MFMISEELHRYEEKWNVVFPDDYLEYLEKIGTGGAGWEDVYIEFIPLEDIEAYNKLYAFDYEGEEAENLKETWFFATDGGGNAYGLKHDGTPNVWESNLSSSNPDDENLLGTKVEDIIDYMKNDFVLPPQPGDPDFLG